MSSANTSKAKRLRLAGLLVLIAGLAGAALLYVIRTRSSAPTMDELMPGYSERRARTNSIIMGNMVVTLMGWVEGFKDPATQAMTLAAVSVLVAWACFWIASLLEVPDPPA